MSRYYQINPETLTIISGPHDIDSSELRKITRCGNPELLNLIQYNIVPEVKSPLAIYQFYGTPEVYIDHVVIPIIEKDEDAIAAEEALALQSKREQLTCTPRQIRLALAKVNLLNTVQSYMDQLDDNLLKIEWEYAIDLKRNHPGIIQAAVACGISETDLDNLFEFAKDL